MDMIFKTTMIIYKATVHTVTTFWENMEMSGVVMEVSEGESCQGKLFIANFKYLRLHQHLLDCCRLHVAYFKRILRLIKSLSLSHLT